jgi:DNA-binding response OmpR family regulator
MRIACYTPSTTVFDDIRDALVPAGFDCTQFVEDVSLLLAVRRGTTDLVLLDVEQLDHTEIRTWLEGPVDRAVPLVMLSAAWGGGDIALALDAGADDCIRRPVDPAELVARLNAVLRRYRKTGVASAVELLGFTLDRATGRVFDRGVPVELTPHEFALAWALFSSVGTHLSQEHIGAIAWGVDSAIANGAIEHHMQMLRKKLNLCAARGLRLRTAYGIVPVASSNAEVRLASIMA